MEFLELMIKILPVIAIVGGLIRYVVSEISKKKERTVAQINELRNSIQNDTGIANVMYLCETNRLTTEFFGKENDDNTTYLYKEIVKTLGLFDTMCYSYLYNYLEKKVFMYFIGEMEEIINNNSIKKYLNYLLSKNVSQIINDENVQTNHFFHSIYPYGFYQLCMRKSIIEIVSTKSHKLRNRIRKEIPKVNQEIYIQFFTVKE